jgi:hypothetical protein
VAGVVHAASVRAALTPDVTGRGRPVCWDLSGARHGRIGDNAKLHAAHVRYKFQRLGLITWMPDLPETGSQDVSAFYGTYGSSIRSGSLGVENSLELYKRTQS